jgi:K+-transporting ATPase KdpF subunit
MTAEAVVALIVSAAVLLYLIYTLLRPEEF